MPLRRRIRFYQQLAVLTRAGVPMRAGLQRLRGRITGPQMDILTEKISAGEPIGDAFVAAGFSPFECHLIAAGERSAQLDTVFQHLADFWDRQRQMFQALVSQLYYPIIVLFCALVLGALYDFMISSLPVAMMNLVLSVVLYGAGGFIVYTLLRVTWNSEAAQRFWLALPLIGRTLSSAYAYRWITAVRLEYVAGIPLPDAVADAWRASGYVGRERLAQEAYQSLREGGELAPLVDKWRQLPRDWGDFIETGEVSGALETALVNLEAEAARAWGIAQKQMNDWMPKIVYFLVLIVVGIQLFALLYKEIVTPIDTISKMLNQ